MKVSIITCCFNSDKTLETCIKSVLNQDFSDIEYIIVDGNSNDNTLSIIKSYQGKVSRWISEKDEGIYDALNKGIQMASGDIIGMLNSDDYFADNHVVSRIVNALESTGAEIVYSDVDFVGNEDSDSVVRHYSSKLFRPWMFRLGFQPAHPTFYTYKRNYLKFGLYEAKFKIAGDFELLLRFLYLHKLRSVYIPDTWVKMRMGGVSTNGINSIVLLNKEIVYACNVNGVWTTAVFVYVKYLVKWWGYILKK